MIAATDYSQGWQAPWPVILAAMAMGLIPMLILFGRLVVKMIIDNVTWAQVAVFTMVIVALLVAGAMFGEGGGSYHDVDYNQPVTWNQ